VTDGVFVPAAAEAACAAPPAFLPVRPINQADLTSLTERVRRRVIRWFRLARLLDAAAAADMLVWVNSGFSVDASVRIALLDRDVRSSFQSLEHRLRYCARPPFALDRLSVIRGPNGRITRVRYVLPRHKAATWVGPGHGRKSTPPGANGVIEFSPFEFLDRLADLVPLRRTTSCEKPSRRWRSGGDWLVFRRNRCLSPAAPPGCTARLQEKAGKHRETGTGTDCCAAGASPSHDTSRIAWAKLLARVGEEFPLECPACGGDIRLIAFITDPGPIHATAAGRSRLPSNRRFASGQWPRWHCLREAVPPPVSPACGPPTDWGEFVQVHHDRDVLQSSPDELPVIDIQSL
jgi:hypothetical protein